MTTTPSDKAEPARRHAALFVFVTVVIDAIGIGIIIPVMPDLLTELSSLSLSEAAIWGGYLSFIYAAMQFLFGPTIGNLSDRFGRRPVLLVSLAALCVDYIVMGLAPTLWMLFITRAIAGVAGATHSTANAYVADVNIGLRVMDVSKPARPVQVGAYATAGYPRGVAVAGGYAYVAAELGGLRVLDVSAPASPVEVGNYSTPGVAWDVDAVGRNVRGERLP